MSDLPNDFKAEYDDSGPEAMGHEVRRRLTGYGEGELDLGPVEVAAGTVFGILAGAFVGILPAIIFRRAILIPVGLLLGTVGGAVVIYILKNRLTVRGWRFGMLGVLVLSLLTICLCCGLGSTIAGFQKMGEADRLTQMAEEAGLGTYNEPPVTAPASAPFCWGGVILLGIGVVFAVGLNFLIRIIKR